MHPRPGRAAPAPGRLLTGLTRLRHSDGTPLIRLYGPRTVHRRGGTVALNVLDARGSVLDERIVARDSTAARISLRTGCFCNPGAGEAAFAIDHGVLVRTGRDRTLISMDDYLTSLGLPSGGAVRVSVGLSSSPGDIDRLLGFLESSYRDRVPGPDTLLPRTFC